MNAPLRAKKKNNTIVWAILGLLVISLTGFGVQSVGSGGAQAVATVGDEKVTVDAYARALNNQLRAVSQQVGQNITLEQGKIFGVDRQVLTQVLSTAALDSENDRIGLSIGDQRVKDNLLATEAFQSLTGGFDKGAYEFALERANLSAHEYDETIRKDAGRLVLQTAIVGGIQANDSYGLALLNYLGESRNFSWAVVETAMLDGETRQPSQAEIEAHYKTTPEAYTAPESRKITYTLLTPDMLADAIDVEDAALQSLYDDQSEKFNQPARRIVDRLVFGSTAEAQEALDKITAGTKIFADIVATRGLSLEDVDMGEVKKTDLAIDAAEAVFSRLEPGLVGPVESSFGPALFRVNAVLAAQSTSFEDAKAELRSELVADMARRQVDDSITDIDDLLAGGATLEEVAEDTSMELLTLTYSQGDEAGIAAYEAFRAAAAKVSQDDYPEVITLSDGAIVALRLDEITPPTLKPLAEVQDEIIADWQTAETRKRVLELAGELKIKLDAGDDFASLSLSTKDEADLRRDAFVATTPAGMVADLFGRNVADVVVLEGRDSVVIARLTAINAFDVSTDDNKVLLTSVAQQYSAQIGSDIFAAFTTSIQDSAGTTINQALINAVHAQIP